MSASLALAAVALAAVTAAVTPRHLSGQPVVDRVIGAYGGARAVASVDAYRQEGMLVALTRGGHGQVTRISSGVGTLSVLVQYPDVPEIRIVEGDRGWRGSSAADLQEVQGPLFLAMVAQAARAYLPRLLLDFRASIREAGQVADRIMLEVPVEDGLLLRLFVDPETHFVVRSESVLLGMPRPLAFATDYSDFRPVNGVVFAFREETFASGVHTASMVLASVEINPSGNRARLPAAR